MGKLYLMLGGPGSGKSKRLREMFMQQSGPARFIECRHKPESISHVFAHHSSDKVVSYLDSCEELPEHVLHGDGPVFVDANNLTVTQVLALSALANSKSVDVYAPVRVADDGSHPFNKYVEAIGNVEYLNVE